MNIALCFCIKNCGRYLEKIFKNIDSVRELNVNLYCIFVYDICQDNSIKILQEYQNRHPNNTILKQIDNPSKARTVRIAKARNACLDIVYNNLSDIKYHIMIDSDNVCCNVWNIKLLNNYLYNVDKDDWDCISFNRLNYYDIWALLFDDFKHHCWGFQGGQCRKVVQLMKRQITTKLNLSKDNNIEVLSAFNGFAIYNTERFKGFKYDGNITNVLPLFTDLERKNTETELKRHGIVANCNKDLTKSSHSFLKPEECCEHIYYHVTANKAGRKIKISKHILTE